MNYLSYVVVLLASLSGCTLQKETPSLTLNPLFTDHMVLQREIPVDIYGTAARGSEVEVSYGQHHAVAITNSEGRWKVTLGVLHVDSVSPDSEKMLFIKNQNQRICLKDVVVGDVWLCSGQSNMQMNLACSWATVNRSEAEVQAAEHPDIRLFSVEQMVSAHPLTEVPVQRAWVRCSPKTAGDFSAVGYFFGRDIQPEVGVPIGLIQSVWGGTIAEAWTSYNGFVKGSRAARIAQQIQEMPIDSADYNEVRREQLVKHNIEKAVVDQGIEGTDTLFAAIQCDEEKWLKTTVPFYLENTALGNINGCVWARKHIQLTAEQVSHQATLHIGPIDDSDETWCNGVKIGNDFGWNLSRVYHIPDGILKAGDNVFAVRIQDICSGGGIAGTEDQQYLAFDDGTKIPLTLDWRIHLGYNNQELNTVYLRDGQPNFPTFLYNAMIHPLTEFALKGVIWYQGENNELYAHHYREDFRQLILDWRAHWKQSTLPFLFVQLANFRAALPEPAPSLWAELRESQASVLNLPEVYMASAIDIGDPENIHPSRKQEVGARLAEWALAQVYHLTDAPKYPQIICVEFRGDKVFLRCNQPISQLNLVSEPGCANQGFQVAGADHKFKWGGVQVSDKGLLITAPKGMKIEAVRYAWADNPILSVFSDKGLPMLPYRSDRWTTSTDFSHAEYE